MSSPALDGSLETFARGISGAASLNGVLNLNLIDAFITIVNAPDANASVCARLAGEIVTIAPISSLYPPSASSPRRCVRVSALLSQIHDQIWHPPQRRWP